jgi:hypothetical protein
MTQNQKKTVLRSLRVDLNVFSSLIYTCGKAIEKDVLMRLNSENIISDEEYKNMILDVNEFKRLLERSCELFGNLAKP